MSNVYVVLWKLGPWVWLMTTECAPSKASRLYSCLSATTWLHLNMAAAGKGARKVNRDTTSMASGAGIAVSFILEIIDRVVCRVGVEGIMLVRAMLKESSAGRFETRSRHSKSDYSVSR
jgi:hypothetical protein